jgi:hypothetical protein
MELIADALLIAGALGAAFYCRTLARRLGALKDLDSGLGAAIAALSRQVDEMRASLDAAKSVSGDQTREVAQLTARAEMAAGRLELLLASLHEGERRRPLSQEAREARAAAAQRDRFGTAGDEAERLAEDAAAGRADGIAAARRREPAPLTRPALKADRFEDDRVTDEAMAMRLAAAASDGERWRERP